MVSSDRLSGPTVIVYHRIQIRFHIASTDMVTKFQPVDLGGISLNEAIFGGFPLQKQVE